MVAVRRLADRALDPIIAVAFTAFCIAVTVAIAQDSTDPFNGWTVVLLVITGGSLVLRQRAPVPDRLRQVVSQEHTVCLCQPVYYEVMRGLNHAGASAQKSILVERIKPALIWTPLNNTDWELAARFWSEVTARGKQCSDINLLIAALAMRLDGIIVSALNGLPGGLVRVINAHAEKAQGEVASSAATPLPEQQPN